MKKSQLRKIIRESIKRLINEQVPGMTSPSPNPANAKQVNWEYCDQSLMNWVAGPGTIGWSPGQPHFFYAGGTPGEGYLANDNGTPPSSNGPNDQFMTQCITLGGGNTPGVGDGFTTSEAGVFGPVIRDAKVTGVGECTSAWGGNTVDLPYACGGSATTTTKPRDTNNVIINPRIDDCCNFCDEYGPGGPSAGQPSTPPLGCYDWMCGHPDYCPEDPIDREVGTHGGATDTNIQLDSNFISPQPRMGAPEDIPVDAPENIPGCETDTDCKEGEICRDGMCEQGELNQNIITRMQELANIRKK